MIKAATFAKLGREEMARTFLQKALNLRPDLASKADFYLGCLIVSDTLKADLLDGLRIAGLGDNKSIQSTTALSF